MSRVRRYYDKNTWKFLLTGSERAIHRELWAPGVTSHRAAMHHAHALVAAELATLRPPARRILDLGCGVGTAALYLAARAPVEVVGVSISPAQIRLADRFMARRADLAGQVRFVEADFAALPADLTGFDLAFAIESFVHADDAAGFFRQASRALRAGGRLVIIDDVLVAGVDPDDPRLADVRTGWHAATLVTVDGAAALAGGHGLALREARDLSSYQRLGRPRDRLIRTLQPLLRRARARSPWAESLVGGDALQRCHRAGLLEYRMLVLERVAAATAPDAPAM
jgi:SAM-dependent methyltransferase